MASKSIDVEKLEALIEIQTLINSNYADLDALLVHILESAMRLVECESSSLLLVKPALNTLYFAVALGPKGVEAKDIPVDVDSSIAGWVFLNNQSVILNDVGSDSRFCPTVQDKTGYISHSMIALPLRVNGECVGVIELLNKANDQNFTRNDLEILNLLSVQAGLAYQNAKKFRTAQNEISLLQNSLHTASGYHTFIAESSAVRDLMAVVDKVSRTNSSVLILGESGVGKELFAEQLHLRSPRSDKPFIRVNCAALSPTLLESELFGHVKGAFTDAVNDRVGRFEAANGGTIFLDEIGELPLDLQAKLLRVIQNRTFEKVGSSETIAVDVRIIAATNKNIEEMVSQGKFRSDLYYRLNVLPICVPPLRQRKEAIEPLAQYFRKKFSIETKKNFEGFSPEALELLRSYYWPGNIRELENSIERACVLGHPPLIQAADLHLTTSVQHSDIESLYGNAVAECEQAEDKTLRTAVHNFKRAYVKRILEENGGNQTVTGRVLGIQRTYLSRLLNELHIR